MHSHRCWFEYYLNIYSWFPNKKTCWNDTWETQKGFCSCVAHFPHVDSRFKLARACQSIPNTYNVNVSSRPHRNMSFFCWYKWMQVVSQMQCQKSHLLLPPRFAKVKQPISAHLSHKADTQIPAETNKDMAVVDWSSRGYSQTSCGQAVFVFSSCLWYFFLVFYMLCIDCARLMYFASLLIFILYKILSIPSELGL